MRKSIVGIIIIGMVSSSIGWGLDSKNNIADKDNPDKTILGESPNIFDLLLTEAKRYYVEALVADYHSDTAEVKFALDKTLENISEISEIDSLTLLQKDDYNRFCE